MDMLVPVLQVEIHLCFLYDIITLATPCEDHLVSLGKLPFLVSRFSYRKIVEIFVNHEVGHKLFGSKIEADRPARARDREKRHPGVEQPRIRATQTCVGDPSHYNSLETHQRLVTS
jgi:hypothetical protein